jgi:membrane protease YdiL (CAAX protease family)
LTLRFVQHAVRYNSFLEKVLPAARQLGPWPALLVWAVLSLAAGLYGAWLGEGGRPFAATLTAFSFLLLVLLLGASRNVTEQISARLGLAAGIILSAALFLAYLIYVAGTNTFAFGRVGAVAALIFLPLAAAVSAERRPPGRWQDFAIVAAVWMTVKFSPARWLWPYPGGKLSYAFTVLLMVDAGIAIFLLTRRMNGAGYAIAWGPRWAWYIAASFLLFTCVAVPLGLAIHFIEFAPRWHSAASLPLAFLGILILTAWPEEFLFRGVLQNLLSRVTNSDSTGWLAASICFGLSHISNGHAPNWRYAFLATIAGLFYGGTWRKTGSIFASAIVHALVDTLWHLLFNTV